MHDGCYRWLFLTGALILLSPCPGFAQARMTGADLHGTVRDASGAKLIGATITVTNDDTNLSRAVSTDETGRYVVPALPPGTYTVVAQSADFTSETQNGVVLPLGQTLEIEFALAVAARETVTVVGNAPIVSAGGPEISSVITQSQIQSLPTNGLYYRLNVFAIYIPPLRERPLDILPLSEAFLAEIGRGIGRPAAGISRDARARLTEYHWPGNVRELRNILERASILAEGGVITPEHLAIGLGARAAMARQRRDAGAPAAPPAKVVAPPTVPVSSTNDLKVLERDLIEQTLQRVHFNKSKAAKDLGLSRQQLYVRMKKYGIG